MLPPERNDGNIEYKRYLSIPIKSLLLEKKSELLSKEELINFCNINEDKNVMYENFIIENKLKKNVRFQQLSTQMKFRLFEGDGTAIYYIGVNDDGSIFELSSDKRCESLKIISFLTKHINAHINNIIFYEKYFKVVIKDNTNENNLSMKEKNILLLGDTQSGKTTFLAYLIKNKLDNEYSKARLHILNHKHEIESGNTSSFTYQYLNFNDYKYVFIDTPGNDTNKDKTFYNYKSIKKRNKFMLSYNFDYVIFFDKPDEVWNKKEFYIKFCSYNNIPFISLNLFDIKNFINLIQPINRSEMIEFIVGQLNYINNSSLSVTDNIIGKLEDFDEKIDDFNKQIEKIIANSITNKMKEYKLNWNKKVSKYAELERFNSKIRLNFVNSFPHQDLGLILTGFLEEGTICKGAKLYAYLDKNNSYLDSENSNKIEVIIKSIHKDGNCIENAYSPCTITVGLENINDNIINCKSLSSFGDIPKLIKLKDIQINFLSNFNHKPKNKFIIEWLYYSNPEIRSKTLNNSISIFVKNQVINLKKINNDKLNDNIENEDLFEDEVNLKDYCVAINKYNNDSNIQYPFYLYDVNNSIFTVETENQFGFGKISLLL